MAGTWLCGDDMDRERLLDMEERLKPVRRVAFAFLGITLVLSAPWIGLWTLLPLALAGGLFLAADARLESSERPEYLMFAAWALSEVTIAAAVALSGGPETATLSWIAIPVVTLSARFSLRGMLVGVALAIGLVLAVAFITNPGAVIDSPPLVMAPIALILATAALSTALMQSDVDHRSEAVVDQLTGMLNRKALANRVDELVQQSELTGQRVGMIVADVDRFKEINDTRGHAAGDAVLTDVAYLFRKQLRAFDLAYRIGGEEFLILLPGADIPECAALAESLREGVASATMGDGVSVTVSFGVSGSPAGAGFDNEQVFAAADDALYEAKSLGRNRVCTKGIPGSDGSAPAALESQEVPVGFTS
jgi:diguanylate cyclase (GGDEF)-like protein